MQPEDTIDPGLLLIRRSSNGGGPDARHRRHADVVDADTDWYNAADAFTLPGLGAVETTYKYDADVTDTWSIVPGNTAVAATAQGFRPQDDEPILLDQWQNTDSDPWTHERALHNPWDHGQHNNDPLQNVGSWCPPMETLHALPSQRSDAYRIAHDYWPTTNLENAVALSHLAASFLPEPAHHENLGQVVTAPHDTQTALDLQNALQIILEDGIHRTADLPAPGCARRGPLTQRKSATIAKKRREKAICIRCRQMKLECKGGIPCSRCQSLSRATVWEQPCLKAHFLEIVRGGTCNYISQRTVNHLTLDETRRITLVLPEAFDLHQLISLIEPRMKRYTYQVRQRWGPLFTLNISKCRTFLRDVSKTHGNPDKHGVLDFIENLVLNHLPGWHECIEDFDSSVDPVTLLLRWNTQPSRASYDTVTINPEPKITPLNVEDPVHQVELLVVAQLTRIICRGLEVQAYTHLQKRLNDKTLASGDDAKAFLVKLGKVLVMLRWQISWRKLFGGAKTTKSASDPMFKTFDNAKVQVPQRFIDRMDRLISTLYFYFCNAKRKLPSFTSLDGLDGTLSTHGDSPPAFDDFPALDTIDGFDVWMKRGEERILLGLGYKLPSTS